MPMIILGGTYIDLDDSLKKAEADGYTTPFTATNSRKENVIIQRAQDYIRLDTYQSNGWIRVNEYYPDGTVTETFER